VRSLTAAHRDAREVLGDAQSDTDILREGLIVEGEMPPMPDLVEPADE